MAKGDAMIDRTALDELKTHCVGTSRHPEYNYEMGHAEADAHKAIVRAIESLYDQLDQLTKEKQDDE